MSNRLDDFVKNNRDDFDKFEPGPVVWHNIQQELKKPAAKQGILISMKVLRWSAAAAILIVLGAAAWYFMAARKEALPGLVHIQPIKTMNPVVVVPGNPSIDTQALQQPLVVVTPGDQQLADNDKEYNEELYHYTKLVELKQNEIKKIKKDEPLLYQQFAGDFNKLDSIFHTLKKQLPVNPNHEQILEAMIQNLQYQEALLGQQLNIIKKINNTKKQEYEKALRTT